MVRQEAAMVRQSEAMDETAVSSLWQRTYSWVLWICSAGSLFGILPPFVTLTFPLRKHPHRSLPTRPSPPLSSSRQLFSTHPSEVALISRRLRYTTLSCPAPSPGRRGVEQPPSCPPQPPRQLLPRVRRGLENEYG